VSIYLVYIADEFKVLEDKEFFFEIYGLEFLFDGTLLIVRDVL